MINDVQPCLNLGRDEGGYFGVPRLVLSYVDYLGALYDGYNGKRDAKTGRRIFTRGKYAKMSMFLVKLILTILDMVRYFGKSTVDLYSPKILKDVKSNRTIGCIEHKQDGVCQLSSPYKFLATHLMIKYVVRIDR